MEDEYYRANKINNDLAVVILTVQGFRVPFLVELEFENVGF